VGGFGKLVHYCQDGGVAIRRGKTRDEVQEYVRPVAVRDRQWLKDDQPELAD
jgi:hypothetical protein